MSDTLTTDADAKLDAAFALLPPIFRKCTDPESVRYAMQAPGLIGEHVYATDGRIAVRMVVTPEIAAAVALAKPEGRFPKVAYVWETLPTGEGVTFPVPSFEGEPKCQECNGVGVFKGRQMCRECDGEGVHECPHCEQAMTCRSCYGRGRVPGEGTVDCRPCAGTGVKDARYVGMEVNGRVTLAYRLLKIIRDAGGVLEFAAVDPHKSPTRFTCPDGVEGVVTPMTSD